MTVAALTPSISYTEDGTTTAFAAPFRYDAPTDLRALRRSAAGVETALVNGVDFTASAGATDAGGTVTVTAAAVAGTTLVIWRDTARAQATDYVEGGGFTAESHEGALDKAMLIAQEQDADLGRAVLAARGEAGPKLDPLADLVGKALVVASDGAGGHDIVGQDADLAESAASASSAAGSAGSALAASLAATSALQSTLAAITAASDPSTDAAALLAGVAALEGLNAPMLGADIPAFLSDSILDIRVNFGQPGHTYIPRLLVDNVGGTNKRITMQLYDATIGEPVAYFAVAEASGWDGVTPQSYTAYGQNNGGLLNNSSLAKFTGASMTVWFKGPLDHSANFNNLSETTSTDLRVNPDRIDSAEQSLRRVLKRDPVRQEGYSIAASGADFTTTQAALASILRSGTVGRGQFPYTYRCSPSHQIVFTEITAGRTEAYPPTLVDQGGGTMLAQGMLIQAGMVYEMNEGTVLHTTGTESISGPLFEFGFGGFITGPTSARLEQRGEGYVIHDDVGNAISALALVGPALQYHRNVGRIEGVTLWAHDGHTDWMIGRGISNLEHKEVACNLRREAGSTTTTAMYGCHSSPESGSDGVRAGWIDFSEASFNDADSPTTGIAFTTLPSDTAQTVRHMIRLGDARVAEVAGTDKYQLIGSPGNATVSSDMVV